MMLTSDCANLYSLSRVVDLAKRSQICQQFQCAPRILCVRRGSRSQQRPSIARCVRLQQSLLAAVQAVPLRPTLASPRARGQAYRFLRPHEIECTEIDLQRGVLAHRQRRCRRPHWAKIRATAAFAVITCVCTYSYKYTCRRRSAILSSEWATDKPFLRFTDPDPSRSIDLSGTSMNDLSS